MAGKGEIFDMEGEWRVMNENTTSNDEKHGNEKQNNNQQKC